MTQGLDSVVQQIQSYGRGPDTMLAHISPKEAQLIDYMQGGRRVNPSTGLPEYGLFGKILKTLARVAGGVVGFALGGPAGAAVGSGLVTKVTGGSWSDALKAGALSGIGGELGQGLTGGGWSPVGAGNGITGQGLGAFTGGTMGAGQAAVDLTGAGAGAASYAIPGGAISSALTNPGVIASGLGGLGTDSQPPGAAPTLPPGPGINLDVLPVDRGYQPYQGNYATYGQGPEHQFFNNINPMPRLRSTAANTPAPTVDERQLEQEFMARGGRVRRYAFGGGVAGPQGPHMLAGPRGPQGPQIPGPSGVPGQGVGQPNEVQNQFQRVRMLNMLQGMAKGGPALPPMPSPTAQMGVVNGPGGPRDDMVPAMLSPNEHVIDAATVQAAGHGSYNKGHKVIENIKTSIRRNAGIAHPKKAPSIRAMRRAGLGGL